MEDFNPMNSLKLSNYINDQSKNLTLEDIKYIDNVDLNRLMLQSEYELVKTEVERFNYLKNAIPNGEVDMVLASDEMKRLRNDIFTQVGQDADMIDLSQLDTATKLETILQNSGIVSRNDLSVRYEDGPYDNNSSYARMVLCEDKGYMKYGIRTGTRMAISNSGKILVPKAAVYNKTIF